MLPRIAVICLCLWTGACAVGVQHRYDATDAKIDAKTDFTESVAVVDARPYVVSGEKPPKFVGLSRGGFGNPFDVTTTTERPLAEDMTTALVSALKANNVSATAVSIPQKSNGGEALSQMLKAKADRNILMTLLEWKADTYAHTSLIHEVILQVFDRSGLERGKTRIDGRDDLGGSAFNPPAYSRREVPKAYRKKSNTCLTIRPLFAH